MTFTLLLGGYFAYVHAFDFVVAQFQARPVPRTSQVPGTPVEVEAASHALWPSNPSARTTGASRDQPYAYYNAERGFWMYALEVEEIQEENGVRYDGKRLRMKPFAMIWKSSDGKSIQTLTADTATLDMNQPVGLSNKQSTEAIKVEHALIEGDVRIRDDRGTPAKLADDMNIGPMTYVDFDDATQQITTDSHVVIAGPRPDDDRRRPADPAAEEGPERARRPIVVGLRRGRVRDPAEDRPRRTCATWATRASCPLRPRNGRPGEGRRPRGPGRRQRIGREEADPHGAGSPSPLDILSDGPMRVDFARNSIPVEEGPPEAPGPTMVRFERNVVALYGHPGLQPDQLNCDTLRLTLVPAAKPPQPKPAKTDPRKPQVPVDSAHGGPEREGIGQPARRRCGSIGCTRCSSSGPLLVPVHSRGPIGSRGRREPGQDERREKRRHELGPRCWHRSGALRQPDPPESPRDRPCRLAPAPRAGGEGALQPVDLRAPRALRARYDLFPGRRDPSHVAREDRPRAGRDWRRKDRKRRRKCGGLHLRSARSGRPAEPGEDYRGHACLDARRDHLRPGERPGPGEHRRARSWPSGVAARPEGTG